MTQTYKTAIKFYTKAAEQGSARAQFNLGVMYYKGLGVAQDHVLAHMWMNLASANGREKASEARDTIAAKMTPSQIEKAQELAREFKARKE